MPTGYTAAVADGTAGPKEFLTHLAQGFGIGGDRDSDENAEVERTQANLARYQRELDDLLALTPAEARERANAAYADAVQRWAKDRQENVVVRGRYEKMKEAVQAWQVGPEVQPIKDYAIEQLDQSIKHDCDFEYGVPQLEDPQAWLADRLKFARRMVKSYQGYVVEAEQARIQKHERRLQFAEAIERA